MGLKDELETEVSSIFKAQWTTRDGNVVPEEDSIKLGNDAVKLSATVLYADISGSTALVDTNADFIAAEMYKTFLLCAAKIIRSESGVVTAYAGDRIMAVYIGDSKNTCATRSALKIHFAVIQIINSLKLSTYPTVKHVVGIDSSDLFVARTGVRGANDLVWVGQAANYAAKLTTLSDSYPTYITSDVYDSMHASSRVSHTGQLMWEPVIWGFNNSLIYRSNWWWNVDFISPVK